MMDTKHVSKFLSLVLRHRPETIGLTLDQSGWADIDALIRLAGPTMPLTRELIYRAVLENDKQRFRVSPDGALIRASQGHSIEVDLRLEPRQPPEHLFHGTSVAVLDSIRAKGLLPGSRQHVHLSAERETARVVGARHGKPHVLLIQAAQMHAAGHEFWLSDNGVWLTQHVSVDWITFEW